jgi:hypothetical protein
VAVQGSTSQYKLQEAVQGSTRQCRQYKAIHSSIRQCRQYNAVQGSKGQYTAEYGWADRLLLIKIVTSC